MNHRLTALIALAAMVAVPAVASAESLSVNDMLHYGPTATTTFTGWPCTCVSAASISGCMPT